jgi:hypothetical protein
VFGELGVDVGVGVLVPVVDVQAPVFVGDLVEEFALEKHCDELVCIAGVFDGGRDFVIRPPADVAPWEFVSSDHPERFKNPIRVAEWQT